MVVRAALAFAVVVCSLAASASPAHARVPLVLIDPGHGGSNTGAWGPTARVHEKRLTLAIARRVARALVRARPRRVRVRLTRGRDRYLSLQSRVRRANQMRADVFISLHLNASPAHSQRGAETYVLSREATSREAQRIASRENDRASRRGVKGAAADAAGILADLRQRAVQQRSVRLAWAVQRRLAAATGSTHARGVRQAPFDVLLGLDMPGVLVEVGFIDHPVEGPRLRQAAAQRRVADAIAAGILAYLDGRTSRKIAAAATKR